VRAVGKQQTEWLLPARWRASSLVV